MSPTIDLASHVSLVDEIMKHGMVRDIRDGGAPDHTAILPASAIPKTGDTEIEFTATSALVSPKEFGGSVDPRKLGIGLISIMIE